MSVNNDSEILVPYYDVTIVTETVNAQASPENVTRCKCL